MLVLLHNGQMLTTRQCGIEWDNEIIMNGNSPTYASSFVSTQSENTCSFIGLIVQRKTEPSKMIINDASNNGRFVNSSLGTIGDLWNGNVINKCGVYDNIKNLIRVGSTKVKSSNTIPWNLYANMCIR